VCRVQEENALIRVMVDDCILPARAKRVIVEGDATPGPQDNRQRVLQRDADDPTRRWGVVCAMAGT